MSCNIQFRNKDYRPPEKPQDSSAEEYWKVPRDIQIGEVTFVDDGGFVLLVNRKRLAIPVGQRLFGEGQGGRTVLKVSEERSQTHLAADVVSGNPQMGDVVVYRHRPGQKVAVGREGGGAGEDGVEAMSDQPTGLRSVPLDLETPLPALP